LDKNANKNQSSQRWETWTEISIKNKTFTVGNVGPKKSRKKKAYLAFDCLKVHFLNKMVRPFTTRSKPFWIKKVLETSIKKEVQRSSCRQ